MAQLQQTDALPPAIVVDCNEGRLDRLLSKEWLLTNTIGAFASSTVLGCNTRRYHGLLIAATSPPGGRVATLTTVMEQLIVGDVVYELATNEFADTFNPRGYEHLAEFHNDVAPTFVFRAGGVVLIKEIMLAESANAVAVRYTLRGADAVLKVRPFVALRDYHHLRKADGPHQMTCENIDGGVLVADRLHPGQPLYLTSRDARFERECQWWYRLRYRLDNARGQDSLEDLYTPGCFVYDLADGQSCQLTAGLGEPLPLGFETTLRRRRDRLGKLAASVGGGADETTRRLAVASEAFVVKRSFPEGPPKTTILAGYPWFADWGRDAFIALPGVLLATGRAKQAREVFATFSEAISAGVIPNRFDDYSGGAHYNSIDASLWFIIAAERYLKATGDDDFWLNRLMPTADAILTAYHDGTQFDIHADADGLLTGGDDNTQLTWMDVKLGEEVITPRHGKAVEINALWHSAHRIMAHRCKHVNGALARLYEERAELIASAFVKTFWNELDECLYDCVRDEADVSIRPNQIFAVSLPYSPLSADQQAGVMKVVTDKLLTPMGLRTLSPDDSRYRSAYGGSWESRDRAYHQGTVWAWLMGPYVEAYLNVENYSPIAMAEARQLLSAFDEHLCEAGLGSISEIFDGDRPHHPRGCFAQAWSVGEILRAKMLCNNGQ